MLDGATRSRPKSASATGDTAPRIPICIHRPFGGRRGQLAFGVLCSNLRMLLASGAMSVQRHAKRVDTECRPTWGDMGSTAPCNCPTCCIQASIFCLE